MGFSILHKSLERIVQKCQEPIGICDILYTIYLADLEWSKTHNGMTYTGQRYYRWNNVVYCVYVIRAVEKLNGIEVVLDDFTRLLTPGIQSRLGEIKLDPEFESILDQLVHDLRNYSRKFLLEKIFNEPNFQYKSFGDVLL